MLCVYGMFIVSLLISDFSQKSRGFSGILGQIVTERMGMFFGCFGNVFLGLFSDHGIGYGYGTQDAARLSHNSGPRAYIVHLIILEDFSFCVHWRSCLGYGRGHVVLGV